MKAYPRRSSLLSHLIRVCITCTADSSSTRPLLSVLVRRRYVRGQVVYVKTPQCVGIYLVHSGHSKQSQYTKYCYYYYLVLKKRRFDGKCNIPRAGIYHKARSVPLREAVYTPETNYRKKKDKNKETLRPAAAAASALPACPAADAALLSISISAIILSDLT